MALWTTISNALVAVGAKPFATTMQALRDNPVAIAEGASGAPRIQQIAFDPFVAGSTYQSSLIGSTNTNSASFVVAGNAIRTLTSGVLRFSASHQSSGGGVTVELRVMLNGVQQAIWTTTSTSPVARSLDLTVGINDVVRFEHRTQSIGQSSTVTGATVGAANSNLWVIGA